MGHGRAAVVAGDGKDDNVRIDSRRREFPDAQASPVTRSSQRVTVPCHAFCTPKLRISCSKSIVNKYSRTPPLCHWQLRILSVPNTFVESLLDAFVAWLKPAFPEFSDLQKIGLQASHSVPPLFSTYVLLSIRNPHPQIRLSTCTNIARTTVHALFPTCRQGCYHCQPPPKGDCSGEKNIELDGKKSASQTQHI